MQKLIDYLKNLNSYETQWGLWVNPDDLDEFRLGQRCLENGGRLDGWKFVGTLDSLSCGYQDYFEAIKEYFYETENTVVYRGKTVKVNPEALLKFWDLVDPDFQEFLQQEVEPILEIWRELSAEQKAREIAEELEQFKKLQKEAPEYDLE